MVFLLLNLPSVALKQVLGGLNSQELFEMHKCSDITNKTLKLYEKGNKTFKVSIDFQRHFVNIKDIQKYTVKRIPDDMDFPETTQIFDGHVARIDDSEEGNTVVYWKQFGRVEGLKTIARDCVKSLGLGQFEEVLIADVEQAPDLCKWILDQNVKVASFNFIGSSAEDNDDTVTDRNDEAAKTVYSDKFFRSVSRSFTSLLNCSEKFVPSVFNKSIEISIIKIDYSHWFTGHHLMCFNSNTITLFGSKLNNGDLNQFLKAWNGSNYTKLKFLSIRLKKEATVFDAKKIIEGIADPKNITVTDESETFKLKGRSDGKSAEVSITNAGKELAVWVTDK